MMPNKQFKIYAFSRKNETDLLRFTYLLKCHRMLPVCNSLERFAVPCVTVNSPNIVLPVEGQMARSYKKVLEKSDTFNLFQGGNLSPYLMVNCHKVRTTKRDCI